MNKPMTFDPEAHMDGGGAVPQASAAQRRSEPHAAAAAQPQPQPQQR